MNDAQVMAKQHQAQKCKHPPKRQFAWWAFNVKTGLKDILCVGCCLCGEVIKGGTSGEGELSDE